VGDSSISAFGMNSTSCGLDASGSGLSMVLRSCEHGDELVVSIKDEKCLEHEGGHQLLTVSTEPQHSALHSGPNATCLTAIHSEFRDCGYHCSLVLGTFRAHMLAVTEVVRCVLLSLLADSGIVPQSGPRPLPLTFITIHYSLQPTDGNVVETNRNSYRVVNTPSRL